MTANPDTHSKTPTSVRASAQTILHSSTDTLRRKNTQIKPYRNGAKRLFDVVVVLASAIFIIPIVVALAILVWLQEGRAFYSQPRVGLDGRIYTMWKLRSMVADADETLETYLSENPEARAEWDKNQKLKNDPRITKLGRVLRKSSLDELPQLLNVLKGDMSLVGPRPMMPDQQALYPGTAYYRLRPGITGPWQVSKRNESTFADRARYDAQYDRRLSFKTDIKLLLATIMVVYNGTGQ